MNSIPESTKILLKAYDWDDVTPRLLRYALKKVRFLTWKGIPNSGEIAQDIVQEAILKTWSGERSWIPETHPDLFIHLKSVIKSLISHAVSSPQNTRQIFESSIFPESNTSFFDTVESKSPSPLQNIAKQEDEKEANEFICNFIDYLHDDTPLTKMFECILDGIDKPRDIAKELNIDVTEVYNLRKRLCRAYENFKSDLDKTEKENISEGGDIDGQA